MATAVSLAIGMGYLALAILMTVLVGGVILALERMWSDKKKGQWQEIKISLPQDSNQIDLLQSFLCQLTANPVLETIKVKENRLELTYLIFLTISDQELLDRLTILNPSWSISLSRTVKKKKSL